ncbi:uncharacterized protein LOC109601708 isoform X2 [Aethina tumida]|uniref:uncharacterized protein LOC109601708 isoform X2 n=1 Tax=Aethina tumida TaxID=116153 RepID=UPI0021477F0E|nr:uncharacterized protein LOC109601708 isoform X2 [Aethina tumida]
MDTSRQCFLLACCLLTVQQSLCSFGPVFINPDATSTTNAGATDAPDQGNYVTQTVYGFLDFTTTIGNTVMVFSPQSAAQESPVTEKKDIASNSVIETKPDVIKEINIEPSKPQADEKKPTTHDKSIISVVQVHTNTENPTTSKLEVIASQVNVVEAKSSVVNVVKPVLMSSKVEVVEGPPIKSTQNIITKVEVVTAPVSIENPVVASKVEVVTNSKEVVSSVVEVKSSNDEPAVIIGNNIGEPEYDFLSRQPSEVVEETYKVINLKPSSKFHLKPRASIDPKKGGNKRQDSAHPTGLVTTLGGTVIKDGTTTVHETSVIGTYISGKYAQVLQSTSHVYNNPKGKINPSPTLRILKTAAPNLGKGKIHHRNLDPTPVVTINEDASLPVEQLFNAQNSVKSTRKPPGSNSKPRFKNRQKEVESKEESDDPPPQPKKNKTRNRSSNEEVTPPSFGGGKRYQTRKNKQQQRAAASQNSESRENKEGGYNRRTYKPKVQPSSVEQQAATTSLYKFKLNRSPGRWQYKTTPKPRVTIRKQNEEEPAKNDNSNSGGGAVPQDGAPLSNDVATPQARSDDGDGLEGSESVASIIDDASTENKLESPFPLETIKVEISTPPDFKDIYYEIATIKSPYTFQAGSVKNTRYITVTSTFEKSLVNTLEATISATSTEPLTENILATSSNYAKDNNFLDSSIATLPPLYLGSDTETPPLETLTETFSTTQTMLKTHILPVVRNGNDTISSTLVQTYLVTRLVTATKTLPPMEAYHFIPSKTLNEFNSHLDEAGSELHLELEFGDQNEQDEEGHQRRAFPPDLDLANIGSDFDLSDVDKSKILEGHLRPKKAHAPPVQKPAIAEALAPQGLNPDQLQQLALLRLLNPAAAQGQVITTSKPVIKIETLYESHVIPVTQGHNTILSTISKIKGTITKTNYEFGTSTLAPALPQIPQVPINPIGPIPPINPINPFVPQAQPQFAVTTSPIVQSTIVTQTQSKILKLTFGAKTAYTTVYSTTVVPTVVTTYMTASIPVQPTAAFPGYFPAPYPQFPFVG